MQCRACMQVDECGEVVDMSCFAPGDTKTFYDYFNDCTQLQANSMDKLPQILCSTCSQILQVAYAFIQEAHQSEEKLKKVLEMSEVEEDLICCNTEQTAWLDYDPLIGAEPTPFEFATSMTFNQAVVRKNNKSPENLAECSTIINHSLQSSKVEFESDEEEPVEHFFCYLCSRNFRLNKTYRQHMKSVHNEIVRPSRGCYENDIYECDICDSVFNNRFAVWAHRKRIHQPIPPASEVTEEYKNSLYYKECTLCSCEFISKQAYRIHMKQAHVQNLNNEETEYECEICNLRFKCRASMCIHKKRRHPKILKASKLNESKNILVETETEVSEQDGSYFTECKYCLKKISTEQVKGHEEQHRNDKSRKSRLLCSSCPREFKYYPALCKHEKKCSSKHQQAPVECPICNKKVRNLKVHMKNMHTSVGEYICSICGDSFKNYVQMYCHKRLHLERKYACTLCEKKFVRPSDLRIHQSSHTGEEPYACHLCDRSFKMKTKLKYHLQRHAGIKQKCNVCAEEFNDIRQLHLHSFKHTGMPYKCPACEYGNAKRAVFRTHLLRIHNLTMTNEELCSMFKANTGRHPRVQPIEELELGEQ